jgi:hypothetical protein
MGYMICINKTKLLQNNTENYFCILQIIAIFKLSQTYLTTYIKQGGIIFVGFKFAIIWI